MPYMPVITQADCLMLSNSSSSPLRSLHCLKLYSKGPGKQLKPWCMTQSSPLALSKGNVSVSATSSKVSCVVLQCHSSLQHPRLSAPVRCYLAATYGLPRLGLC